jgi:transglutaminase-like putative cysteine protease
MTIERLTNTIALALVLAISIAAESAPPTDERWHVLSIDGTAVGSVHETYRDAADRSISSESMLMVLNRLGSRIETSTVMEAVEDESGELVSVELAIRTSEQTMRLNAFRDGDDWVTRSETPGVPDRRRPLDAAPIGPRAVAERLAELSSPGDTARYLAFVPTTMQPGEIRAELVGFETVGDEALRVIEEHLPGLPAPMTRVIDRHGRNVITRMPGPFGQTETVLADEVAATLAQAGAELPDEVFEATILKTGVRLPEPRRLDYLELELTHRNPALGWPDLNSAHQRVLSRQPDRLVLAIERRRPRQSVPLDASVDAGLENYLSANALLQTAEPALVERARSLTADETDRWQAALALRRWVSEQLSFDAGVVLASSSEVLANRRGTCTEYAVLLTALARAAGIPARYVTGYVYAHGMLAGHAWTEIRIGDDWLALDAAIPSDGAADAARFAFHWSDLNDGPGDLNAGPALQMFGQIDARVIAWRSAGRPEQRYPDHPPAPTVEGRRFIDRVQGIEWSVPAPWRVTDHQQTWPSNLIAAAEHSDGDRVELRWISQNPWERAGIDWIEPRLADSTDASVEAQAFGRRDSWLMEDDGRFHFVQAGPDGHWQLIGDSRERLRKLARDLVLPTS